MKAILFLILVSFFASPSHATIDSIGKVEIPYTPVHAELDFEQLARLWSQQDALPQMYCMTQFMYFDHISSSAYPTYQFLTKEFRIPSYPSDQPDVQINQLADSRLQVTTDWDQFNEYVESGEGDNWSLIHEPEFEIDVSGFDQSTKAGRLEAITKAKLAIISIHYNLAWYGSLFRVTIKVKGLPADQSEFDKPGWTKAYATTQSPYSGPSPLAQKYYSEILAEAFCKEDLEKAQSFAK